MGRLVWVVKASAKKRRVRREKVTVTYSRLAQLGKQTSARINADLVRGLKAFKKRVPEKSIVDALEVGDYLAAVNLIPWVNLSDDLEAALKSIGDSGMKAAEIQIQKLPPNINKRLRFDRTNPAMRQFLRERTGELITGIEDDARANIADVIAGSFTRAQTPRQLAERIKGSIGLLPTHEAALANYRAGLVASGADADQVEELGDAYEDRLLDYRAMMIARTETRSAIVNGQLTVWREGARQGLIENARKEWVVDGNPCEICEPMEGVTVPLDEPFLVEGEEIDGPPEPHPHCECGLELHFGETQEEET